jgi:ribonucleoside-diphosphate reductase alpha chain
MLINQDNPHISSISNTSVSDSNTIIEKKNNQLPSINFLDEISDFIFISKYARYNEDQKRRETLSEAIDRVSQMHLEKYSFLSEEDKQKIKWAFELVKQKKVVPSMRSMQFGGKAVFAHNSRLYNCGTRHIDSLRAFSEFFYCLLTGTGMTAGVSKKIISRLPDLVTDKDKTGTILTYTIQDDIEGWADSIEALLMCYHKNTPFTGRKIVFDYSKIRKKGSPLKTGGGKAPGHAGLKQTHTKIKNLLDHIIEDLHLNNLRSIDIYDILMHCADAVLSGGIRRAATAVIFDPDDMGMMNAKTNFTVSSYKRFEKLESGFWEGTVIVNNKKYEVILSDWEYNESLVKNKEIGWYHIEPQRARSNNSVLLLRNNTTKEQLEDIINKTRQWGEPGFVFADDPLTLFNPCFEIAFKPITEDGRCGVQFCNLSSINGAKVKNLEDWKLAIEASTIIGTLQAGYTEFPYLSKTSEELTKEEALLGVSLTGWFDNPKLLLNEENQYMMSKLAIKVNKEWCSKININQASRITCVKPEGTSSLFLGSSSGIHPHHAHRYFRRVQVNKLDNVYNYFKVYNSHATEESVWSATKSDDVITFPLTVPKNAIVKSDLTAIEHLNHIRKTQENWVNSGITEVNKKPVSHNVSCTVEVDENEWVKVIDYLYENRKYFSAVSLLPKVGDNMYKQAPLQRVYSEDEQKWEDLVKNWKSVDWEYFNENEDFTKLTEQLACAGGACEVPWEKNAS